MEIRRISDNVKLELNEFALPITPKQLWNIYTDAIIDKASDINFEDYDSIRNRYDVIGWEALSEFITENFYNEV